MSLSKILQLCLVVGLSLFAVANCKSTLATGKFMATTGFEDKYLEKLSETKIEGRGCRQHIFFVPIGELSFNGAFADALSKSPEGTTGFMYAEMGTEIPVFGGLLFGRYCAIINGYPAKSTAEL